MPRADQEHSFLRQQLSNSRDLGGSHVSDLLFGGLNHHIEHHLFPGIALPRLRDARPIVRSFCSRHGLRCMEANWPSAMGAVFAHFQAMARVARRRNSDEPSQEAPL